MLDKYFPLVRLSRKKFKDKPWITNGIKVSIRHRNKLYKRYIENRTVTNEQNWKKFRNKVTDCIRTAETHYYRTILTEHGNNCQNLWKIFGKMIKKNRNKVNIDKLKVGNQLVNNPKQITESFNNFFTNVGNNLAQSLESSDENAYKNYLGNPIQETLNLTETNPDETQKLIERINPKKSTGSDDLPGKFLIISAPIVAGPISKLFNLAIFTGEYPNALKIAKVLPIYKKGEHTDMNNYRPISILTQINKIFEQLLCNQMKAFFNNHDIFYKYQYGFRENHSTEQALIELTDRIKLSIDNKELACGIFIDLRKAFDTVNHKILIEKLKHVGVRGIPNQLINSYLTNRSQYIQLNNTKSDLMPINYGVPQGSVLGPLLFTIYINDLANCCQDGKVRIFADDTAVYFTCMNTEQLLTLGKSIMEGLDTWFKANLLTLNTDKSYFCIFRSSKRLVQNMPEEIEFNNKFIKRKSSVKYLGVILDEYLDWNEHISEVCKSLKKYFSIYYNIKKYLTLEHARVYLKSYTA